MAEDNELVVIGSQAILAQFPNAPDELTYSREVDAYPRNNPEAAERLDAVLGELSQFDDTFGFYVHGVGPETAVLPAGWETRLVRLSNANTRDCIGWCLEVHDLAASKLAAGRQKDLDYVAALLRHRMVDNLVLRTRIAHLPLPEARRDALERTLGRLNADSQES